MSEIDEYMRKANRKLKSSKLLLEEGDYSDCVSLAYYAMYLTAKVLLIKKEIYPKTHSGLIHVFGKEYVHEDNFDSKVYSYLSSTQSLREQADYQAVDDITRNKAVEKIIQAEEFIKEAEKFL